MRQVLSRNNVPSGAISLIENGDRQSSQLLMTMRDYIDLLIPRGGASLIRAVKDNATVPVIETGAGNCHIYIEESAELDMAKNIIVNAKVQRPSVCNAAEKILIDEKIAKEFLPVILAELERLGVEIHADSKARAIYKNAYPIQGDEWGYEYLSLTIGVRVVDNYSEAIEHINKYSTHHSDCIVTGDENIAGEFLRSVDSAAVYWNASTRFTDGGEFGLGAEIGISTQKFHARGPMGIEEIMSYKYMLTGAGQVRG
jgi:glutamate-5-semialdehyde dehydrogenase